jgi:predicted dehydrogenase
LWSNNAITDVRPITQEAVDKALKEGPYGRCVFACDNDVVDNQICTMTFENGVTANLRMTAFTRHGGRIMKFYGTYGEIDYEGDREEILIKVFGKPVERIDAKALVEDGYGHGGGDAGLIRSLHGMITGENKNATTLEASIESHLMGFAAERSRLKGGKVIKIKH